MVPEACFSRAYASLGDRSRSLIKGLIARHYQLDQPMGPLSWTLDEHYPTMRRESRMAPVSFALLLVDDSMSAPAFLLAALIPALCARVPHVLVAWMGSRSAAPDTLLTACELAGQERVAAFGPIQVQRLLDACMADGRPGVVLYPGTAALARLLQRPTLAERLAASTVRLLALRRPWRVALWRDTADIPPADDVSLLYGVLQWETNRPGQDTHESDWLAFCNAERDLLVCPDERARQGGAAVTVATGSLGMWRWPGLGPQAFLVCNEVFSPA
ncbi:hypothetical protein [Humidesulfovibrio mexicanus]|nr:hypothetical protein [Humidesulfovibrio mexicanus]